jgi:hypothetical protein
MSIALFILIKIRQFMQTDLYFELIEHTKTLINV